MKRPLQQQTSMALAGMAGEVEVRRRGQHEVAETRDVGLGGLTPETDQRGGVLPLQDQKAVP